jgi:hypothetical protein
MPMPVSRTNNDDHDRLAPRILASPSGEQCGKIKRDDLLRGDSDGE